MNEMQYYIMDHSNQYYAYMTVAGFEVTFERSSQTYEESDSAVHKFAESIGLKAVNKYQKD